MDRQTLTSRIETAERREVQRRDYKKSRIEASYFPVEKVKYADNKHRIINKETGDVLTGKDDFVTDRYTVVQNRQVFQPFVDRFGIDNVKTHFGYGNNKFYYMEINTGRRFNFGTEENPDFVDERMIIQNSYNKSKSFSFMVGAFRWVCSNGLYSGTALVSYKKIHVGEIPVMKLVFEAMLKYEDNTFDTWKDFQKVNLTVNQEKTLIERFEAKEVKRDNESGEITSTNAVRTNRYIRSRANRLIESRESVDNQRNGWGLYNQLNRAINYEMNGKSKVSEKINANKRLEEFLKAELLENQSDRISVGSMLN